VEDAVKLVINKGYGPFCLSYLATAYMAEKGDEQARAALKSVEAIRSQYPGLYARQRNRLYHSVARDNPLLLALFPKLGAEDVSGEGCKLVVVEVPPGEENWRIEKFDGGCESLIVNANLRGVPLMTPTAVHKVLTPTSTCGLGRNHTECYVWKTNFSGCSTCPDYHPHR
jgi:hypothetical protein